MSVFDKAPLQGRGRPMRRNVQQVQENSVQRMLDEHKKNQGEVICIRIDARTTIELSANLSEEERAKRIRDFMKNTNYKLPK